MALLDFSPAPAANSSLVSGEIFLRHPRVSDYSAWRDLREASRAHLTRWEPDWLEEEATLAAFKKRIKSYEQAAKRRVAAPYFMFRRSDDRLIGGVSLINIVRGASLSAGIGYWIGADYVRRGHTRNGVRALLGFAFNELGLNRIEAACQPSNTPSRGLLASMGFREEGYAHEYLFINGAWRDHIIYAMTASSWDSVD